MSGSNYIRGKRGMVLLAETLQRLQLDVFASLSHDALKDAKVQENMIALPNPCQNHSFNTNYSWGQYQKPLEEFLQAFDDFVEISCLTFPDDILPILVDLTKSIPERD